MGEVRRRWTATEDSRLWELYQIQEKAPTGKSRKINWNEIAHQIPGRSNKDCRKRYYNRFTGGLRKGSWTPDEDARLTGLVERYHYRWAMIAQKMETRNADQCSKRWHHCLNPELERSPWTDEECQLLLSAVGTHGSRWKDIQKFHFPTRSANNIKNQYTILSRRSNQIVSLEPCCNASALPESLSKPPTPSMPEISTPHAIREPSHDAYSYCSLSSTPQLSSIDYMATTPDISMNHVDLAAPMPPLSNDPSAYLTDNWLTSWMNGTLPLEPMFCESPGMGAGIDIPQIPENTNTNTRWPFVEIEDRVGPYPSALQFPPTTNAPFGF